MLFRSPKDVEGKGKEAEGKNILAGTDAEDNRVWLHCSVGDGMEDDEIEGERVQVRGLRAQRKGS